MLKLVECSFSLFTATDHDLGLVRRCSLKRILFYGGPVHELSCGNNKEMAFDPPPPPPPPKALPQESPENEQNGRLISLALKKDSKGVTEAKQKKMSFEWIKI